LIGPRGPIDRRNVLTTGSYADPAGVNRFRALLAWSSQAIGRDYFTLPVANVDDEEPLVKYRGRVYAYELYHRLRSGWPDQWYSLGGEIDKSGHPLIRGGDLDLAKPDLLIHVPGQMDRNLVVVEIKAAGPTPPAGERAAIETDLKKLGAFHTRAQYDAAILLVFGPHIDRIRAHVVSAVGNGVSLDGIELWHHPAPDAPARLVPWNA
jgi:hypothetical protein